MNQRIQEIAEQIIGLSRLHGGEMALMGDKQVEKFAELIVRECADVCQAVTNSGEFTGNQQYASAMCRDMVKKHFGVE